ncbi:MAG TPA: hypothetical protein VF007_06650 [Stellaceae bacterium]
MPFDGVGYISSEPLRKIDVVIDLLSTPDKWCKGALRSHDGRYCIRGAVMSVGATDLLEPAILQAIGEVAGRRFRRIESFNDYPNTTHEQIVTVLQRARDNLTGAAAAKLWSPAAGRSAPASWSSKLCGWLRFA